MQGNLDTLVADLTHIGRSGVEARGIRYGAVHQHVGGTSGIDIDGTVESIVEDTEVETQVVLGHSSPSKSLVAQCAGVVCQGTLVVKPCVLGRDGRVGGVSAYRPATVLTPREAQFTIVEPRKNVLEEVFLAEYPCARHTVEVAPLVVLGESGESIATVVEGEVILAVEVVVETCQISGRLGAGTLALHILGVGGLGTIVT